MNIAIKATHLELTSPIKRYVDEKVGNLSKYIHTLEGKVELERDRHHHKGEVFRAEIMLVMGGKLMRADAEAEDIYAAVDLCIPKLKEQIAKFKDKKTTQYRRGARTAKGKIR
ncbi:MAG: ribosome-associated translation inhibitor RaiA [Candidatus Doudnabacteria bacterium]